MGNDAWKREVCEARLPNARPPRRLLCNVVSSSRSLGGTAWAPGCRNSNLTALSHLVWPDGLTVVSLEKLSKLSLSKGTLESIFPAAQSTIKVM